MVGKDPEIIDVHLHAMYRLVTGSNRGDGAINIEGFGMPLPPNIRSHTSYEEYRKTTFDMLEKHNIKAVTSGTYVKEWHKVLPERIIPGVWFVPDDYPSLEEVKDSFARGEYLILGEVGLQYIGMLPGDSEFDPYLTFAEEYNIPVCVHMNGGGRGSVYNWAPKYRASLSNPLLLEETLIRHPKLRLWLAHAGWPMLDEMINMLFTYPQLYIDVSFINWWQPRKEFYRYLSRIVDAGFCDQVMYGSDQIYWPDAIPSSINAIKFAEFLTESQKQDILYNNAVKFLRL